MQIFSTIKTFIFDIDGVLTDNRILVTEEGKFLRSMNVRDGYAIKTAIAKGYQIIIISGGKSEGTYKRLSLLGITEIHLGIEDKKACLLQLQAKHTFDLEQCLYMGDDILDISVMQLCGIRSCPNDAVPEVKQIANYISTKNGGDACVRDVIEQVLKAQSLWHQY